MLKPGNPAPAFTLKNENGENFSLSKAKGKWLVLYFYPKDMTSGCTAEACDFTENIGQFRKKEALVWGVSPDSVDSHRKFVEKKSLEVSLLADEGSRVCQKYGVWQLKKLYGKEYMGVVRTTFLIDPRGKIAHIWPKVKVNGHIGETLKKLSELRK